MIRFFSSDKGVSGDWRFRWVRGCLAEIVSCKDRVGVRIVVVGYREFTEGRWMGVVVEVVEFFKVGLGRVVGVIVISSKRRRCWEIREDGRGGGVL